MSQAPRRERLLLGLTVLVQVVVLYAPRAPSDGDVPGLDKVVHAAVFAAVAIAALRYGWARVPVVLLLVAHAVVSEVVQHTLLPGRTGDPLDVVADVAGVGLGLAVGVVVAVRRRRRLVAEVLDA